MKKNNIKDNKRRKSIKLKHYSSLLIKALLRTKAIRKNDILYYKLQFLLQKFTKLGKKTQITNRCVLTTRSNAVHSKFRLSRISIRQLSLKGQLVGLTKSSW